MRILLSLLFAGVCCAPLAAQKKADDDMYDLDSIPF